MVDRETDVESQVMTVKVKLRLLKEIIANLTVSR